MAHTICIVASDINLQRKYCYAKLNLFLQVHSDMYLKNNRHRMTVVFTLQNAYANQQQCMCTVHMLYQDWYDLALSTGGLKLS